MSAGNRSTTGFPVVLTAGAKLDSALCIRIERATYMPWKQLGLDTNRTGYGGLEKAQSRARVGTGALAPSPAAHQRPERIGWAAAPLLRGADGASAPSLPDALLFPQCNIATRWRV